MARVTSPILRMPQSVQHQLDTAVYMLTQREGNIFLLVAGHQSIYIRPRSGAAVKPRRYGKHTLALHLISRCCFVLGLGGSIAAFEILLTLRRVVSL